MAVLHEDAFAIPKGIFPAKGGGADDEVLAFFERRFAIGEGAGGKGGVFGKEASALPGKCLV
jgi:hypothetical protein